MTTSKVHDSLYLETFSVNVSVTTKFMLNFNIVCVEYPYVTSYFLITHISVVIAHDIERNEVNIELFVCISFHCLYTVAGIYNHRVIISEKS